MNSQYFNKRCSCPGCKKTENASLFACKFTENPVKEYLKSFYAPQGFIEFHYLVESYFAVRECNNCELIYQEYIPNDFLLTKLYDEWIDPEIAFKKEMESDIHKRLLYSQEIITLINHFCEKPYRLKFLDVGMGWAGWCKMAMAFGCQTYGVELSLSRIKYAKAHGINILNWEEIADQKFHFINTEQLFEHIPEPLATIEYLEKSLEPNGVLKVFVPDGSDLLRRLSIGDWTAPRNSKNSLYLISPLEHLNCFNKKSILTMAELAGLKRLVFNPKTHFYYYYGKTFKEILRNILRPIYRHRTKYNGTYLLFSKRGTG